MSNPILIEGYTTDEILAFSNEEIDGFALQTTRSVPPWAGSLWNIFVQGWFENRPGGIDLLELMDLESDFSQPGQNR